MQSMSHVENKRANLIKALLIVRSVSSLKAIYNYHYSHRDSDPEINQGGKQMITRDKYRTGMRVKEDHELRKRKRKYRRN